MTGKTDAEMWDDIFKQFQQIRDEIGIEPDDNYEKELEELFGMSVDEMNRETEVALQTQTLQVQKIHEDAIYPSYNYPTDSGFDLHSVEDVNLPPFGRKAISTGLKLSFEEGYEIQIRPKSGLALNHGLTVLNTPGTVDAGYTGEIKVILFNSSNLEVKITKGMKIAQGVLCPVKNGRYVNLVPVDVIGNKDRGENGFGSTGIY